ncbi:MAG: hypothetical protein RL321_1680 [Pseudomonadota bacterium]
MYRRVSLRTHLTKNQHHEGQNAGTDGDPFLAIGAQHDDGDQSRREIIDEVITEQDQADQPIRTLQQPLGEDGTPMALVRHRA